MCNSIIGKCYGYLDSRSTREVGCRRLNFFRSDYHQWWLRKQKDSRTDDPYLAVGFAELHVGFPLHLGLSRLR